METGDKVRIKIFPKIIKISMVIGHTLTIMLYLTIMILELRLTVAEFSPSTTNLLMLVGAFLWGVFLFDPLVTQTKRWAVPIYPMIVIMALISFVAIFLDTTNPLSQFARLTNAGISVVAFLVCSYRIKKSQMEYI